MNNRGPLTAIDLFSGAGGISLGLQQAGFRVLLGSDVDPACANTYRHNFPGHQFLHGDIRKLSQARVKRVTGLRRGELDLLIAGPPCQGFSIIGTRVVHDERNDFFLDLFRVARALMPRAIVIENVPGIATLHRGAFLNEILAAYDDLGYDVTFAELLAAQYGVPQMRWRMIFVGFRKDLGIPAGMGVPAPTHGRRGIGSLVPNCTITAEDSDGFLTTWDAIGDLPPTSAGVQNSVYDAAPAPGYQSEMRRDLTTELYNHYAPKLSQRNLDRIAALRAGQDWRDLPRELLPLSMQRAKRKDHTRRFSRMTWTGVPRSIITRFRDPKSGEYTHPNQNRTISIREAARIQSFPDSFQFLGTLSELYEQVGNAVPVRLARAIGLEVAACLEGGATHILENPFSRRGGLRQLSLLLNPA